MKQMVKRTKTALLRATLGFCLGLVAVLAPTAPAQAGSPTSRDLIKGCYRLSPNFDGPAWVNFCLSDFRSKYTVRGDRFCRGKLRWRLRGGRLTAKLAQTECRSGDIWPAATLTCRVSGITGRGLHDGFGPIDPAHLTRFPFFDNLRCTYRENASGQTFRVRALKR
jgi:hypothetical protein